MTDLPWNNFLAIAGDPRHNFEVLCRELVRRHYGGLGSLLTRKQQPGVEFHLRLERPDDALGEANRHWGWQCRWYEPDAFWSDGSRLKEAQRKKIVEAIEKTAVHVPGLSDWVLWTREKLGAKDGRWFDSLQAPFTIHRWDEETVVGLLSGPAEVLRRTWFGDLVLDQETLVRARKISLAPVEHRYEAELHVRTPPERDLERVMPGLGTARRIAARMAVMEQAASDLQGHSEQSELAVHTRAALTDAAERAEEVAASIEGGRLPSAEEVRAAAGDTGELDELVTEIARQVEAGADPDGSLGRAGRALEATHSQLMQIADDLELGLVVIVGGAGAGKTHLAAHISGPDEKPAGVLLLGRLFEAKIADDDLAHRAGLGTTTEQLLESLEALGLREGRRVPLVIDGINESDDASGWKDALARLGARLDRFSHVVAIVTLRPGYAKLALPAGSKGFRLEGFAGIESVAVARYFDYYKIRADRSAIDWWRPSDPLLLAIFCRVVNGERKEEVTASDLPRSLCDVFERHLEEIVVRIGEATGLDPDDVTAALGKLARRFLETGARELEVAEVGEALGDPPRVRWKDSLRFQVESEEVLVRDVFEGREKALFGYDLLGGHLIAKDLLARHSPEEIAAEPLAGEIGAHPLREDIITGLTGLLGAAGREPSVAFGADWAQASQVALASARLPGDQLGEASVAAIVAAFAERPEQVLEEIAPVALRPDHPLNATVLDRLLGGLEVWRRDLIWSEWVRERSETIMIEASGIERRLADGEEFGDPAAILVWLSWLLTSTDKPLRDTAIKALYRLGQTEPHLLFDRAIEQFGANDPAIPEGLLAAAYGVAMASQGPGAPTREAVIWFAAELQAHLLGPAADKPTWHWLIREYAYRTTQLASWMSGGEFEAPADAAQPPLPAPSGRAPFFRPASANWRSVDHAFHMDFANYTIGRLVEGRANYDDQHPRFQRISGEIRARVAELGWSARRFDEVDRAISEGSYSRMNDPEKVERYGKKYSWAGFYEAAGRLSDRGQLHGREPSSAGWRISDVPLDPSFPQTTPMPSPEVAEWAPEGGSDEDWARNFQIDLPDRLLRTEAADGCGWIALDGYLYRAPADSQRKVFCFIRGLLALQGWSSIEAYLAEHPIEAELVPGNAAEYYCFAGEAPWSPTFDSWATQADGASAAERRRIGWRHEDGPEIELLGVDFNWESYHSVLNQAAIGSLPSKAFCRSAALSKVADRAEFVDPDGEAAVRALGLSLSEDGWRGHVLWAREDLVEAYCRERGGDWGWIVWGEREVHPPEPGAGHDLPDWMVEVRRNGLDRFDLVTSLAELQGA